MESATAIRMVAHVIDIAGVIAIVGGGLVAVVLGATRIVRGVDGRITYKAFRHDLGRAIIIGLELLVAADIVHTIGETPTLLDLAALAAIVAIRTALSFTLAAELDGEWPWQAGAHRQRELAAESQPPTLAH